MINRVDLLGEKFHVSESMWINNGIHNGSIIRSHMPSKNTCTYNNIFGIIILRLCSSTRVRTVTNNNNWRERRVVNGEKRRNCFPLFLWTFFNYIAKTEKQMIGIAIDISRIKYLINKLKHLCLLNATQNNEQFIAIANKQMCLFSTSSFFSFAFDFFFSFLCVFLFSLLHLLLFEFVGPIDV